MITNDDGSEIQTSNDYYCKFPYGIYLPSGNKEIIKKIRQYCYVKSLDYHNDIHYINGNRVRTPSDPGSHPCYNCGHCIDNGLKVCRNWKCYKDRRKRGICCGKYKGDSCDWLHDFFKDFPPLIYSKKGVNFRQEICRRCGKTFRWLVDYQQDFHVIQFNQFNKKQYKVSLSYNTTNRTAMGELRHLVYQRDSYKCLECGATKEEISLEIDHIVPWSKGGQTELDNLQTLCKKCNRSKHTRTWVGGELADYSRGVSDHK